MKTPEFTSAFAAQLSEYLAFKAAMGCYGNSRVWHLRKFDAYCAERGLTVFDRDTVEDWVKDQLQRSAGCRSWISYIRDFGRWLNTHAGADAYVLSGQWKAPFTRTLPYLLTRDEIEHFFTAAAQLEAQSPWRWQAAAFFTLMHSCGIRTGEARALKTSHADLANDCVDIIDAKGKRSRRLPVNSDVTEILAACDQMTRARFASRKTFFVSATGAPVTAAAVGVIFNRIWNQAGLARPASGRQPRPYDFRHHFAYANIERWMADGTDVAAMLPYLSRYMGHATFESTYYYIHTSPDFMRDYGDITRNSQSPLPEAGFE